MLSPTVETIVKMVESLPEEAQNQILEHLSDYIADLCDVMQWDQTFQKTQKPLVEAARRAREETLLGYAKPFSLDDL